MGETYVRINSAVKGKVAIITCNTIADSTNKINMLDLIATNLERIMGAI